MTEKSNAWTPKSWRSYPAKQLPNWPDINKSQEALRRLSKLPALVFAGETRALKNQLRDAAAGRAFVLQAGDCAESFSRCHGPYIHDLLKVILQMAVVLAYAGEKKIVTIGRIAGQYAKPRSEDYETIGGITTPSYRGDMINGFEGTLKSRTPNPERMIEGYFCSAATLNLVRAFTKGGYASLNYVSSWNESSFGQFHVNPDYKKLCADIQKAVNFMTAIGIDAETPQMHDFSMYTSHEALLLDYEEALTRVDTTTGLCYDTSAHMLWIGDRTRQSDGAHIEFARGICNPLGLKIGPTYCLDEVKKLIQILNPDNKSGRLSLITRFGADKISDLLPPLLESIKQEGSNIVWICDPMHGNTYVNKNGQKTRDFETIAEEIKQFFQSHLQAGTVAGGIHLELSGDNVTECSGGKCSTIDTKKPANYQSTCDPRLNAEQGIELAFEIAKLLSMQKPENCHAEI